MQDEIVFKLIRGENEYEYYTCPLMYASEDVMYIAEEHEYNKLYSVAEPYKTLPAAKKDAILQYENAVNFYSEKLMKKRNRNGK